MPAEGEAAPRLRLPSHDGATVDLAGLKGRTVAIFFYPRAATPG